MKKISILLAIILTIGLFVITDVSAEDNFKAALLVSGNVDDQGWNQYAYEGLQLIEEEHGWEIAYTESVSQSDQYDIIRSYANQGFDLIVGHGYEYEDALTRAANQYPDVYFLQIGGQAANGDNLSSAIFADGHSGYLPGVFVAHMTETEKIGFVGAEAIPTVVTEFAAMRNAIEKTNPDIEIIESFTGSWVDVGAARETAIAQINQGVDIIIPIGDAASIGVIEAALEEDIYVIGWSRDQRPLAPELVIASLEQRVDWAIVDFAEKILNDEYPGDNIKLGLDNGYIQFTHFLDFVPDEYIEIVRETEEKIIDGEIDLLGEYAR